MKRHIPKTDLVSIPNEFGRVLFGLGAQRGTLLKLEIQFLHLRSRIDKQFALFGSIEALTFSDWGSDSGIASIASLLVLPFSFPLLSTP